jgi:signal transduction histidine kinase
MKNLMMDLLDLAQVESNTFKINKAQFSLLDVIDEAFVIVSHIASMKNIKLVAPVL